MNVFIANIEGLIAVLGPDESHHCSKVLRNKVGDHVELIDGKGNYYKAVLDFISDKQCRALIVDGTRIQPIRPYQLHVAIAPTKNMDRMEWLLEKAVEIGIDEITFIKCHNSERTIVKPERIHKIVETAVKQSLQARIPKVNSMISFEVLCKQNTYSQKFIAHCYDSGKQNIKNISFNEKKTIVLIGPEGDFSLEEVKLAKANNFKEISLGDHRLRTETAGLLICMAAKMLG